MKLTTAGESHGKGLIGIIENVPSNLKIDIGEVNRYLALRQSGYGRGGRQKIETDKAEILSGVRGGLTLGSPISFIIKNKDYDNWSQIMSAENADFTKRTVTKVRPGHADLSGLMKFDHRDARNILERASARETAVRVASGTIARGFLREFGIQVEGYVKQICGVTDENIYTFEQIKKSKESQLFMLDKDIEKTAMQKIDELKKQGDTAGGVVEIRVKGIKSGFGSPMQYDRKIDAQLAGALFSLQAVKGVEIGLGFSYGKVAGSLAHDEIFYDSGFYRKTNNAGGIEGGMTNGEEIIIKLVKKPIPTLMKGLRTVDYITKEAVTADTERSDTVAIAAFEIIAESIVCQTLAAAVIQRLGEGNMAELKERWERLP